MKSGVRPQIQRLNPGHRIEMLTMDEQLESANSLIWIGKSAATLLTVVWGDCIRGWCWMSPFLTCMAANCTGPEKVMIHLSQTYTAGASMRGPMWAHSYTSSRAPFSSTCRKHWLAPHPHPSQTTTLDICAAESDSLSRKLAECPHTPVCATAEWSWRSGPSWWLAQGAAAKATPIQLTPLEPMHKLAISIIRA